MLRMQADCCVLGSHRRNHTHSKAGLCLSEPYFASVAILVLVWEEEGTILNGWVDGYGGRGVRDVICVIAITRRLPDYKHHRLIVIANYKHHPFPYSRIIG